MDSIRLLFIAVSFALILLIFSGCSTTITPGGQLSLGLSGEANFIPEIVADFEAIEEGNTAGGLTKQSGSHCANGVCTVY